jgi:hypothetical protein
MWWVLGDVVRAADNAGGGMGWVAFAVLLIYGSVIAFVVVSWARWMVRQRRGIVHWGERDHRVLAPRISRPRPAATRPGRTERDEREQATG